MEEIRMKYYSQLKRFLAIPNNFRVRVYFNQPKSFLWLNMKSITKKTLLFLQGVSELNDNPIFPIIVTRNAHRFGPLFQRANRLFERVEAVKERFTDLAALGHGDIEQVIQQECSLAEHWDRSVASTACAASILIVLEILRYPEVFLLSGVQRNRIWEETTELTFDRKCEDQSKTSTR